ncbi:tRNA nucleotidyltransferase/poly(A) polymerase [Lachnospiraceae bacterium PFB1-21]
MYNGGMKKFILPKEVHNIIEKLEVAGYEAYAVGGCVRDTLLGREPEDWDITTQAMPEQVKSLFPRTVDTGIEHGTVTVLVGGQGFEVTTYRIDGEYEDARHPTSVAYTRNLEEDLKRRDFTINAMAYSESRGFVDLFGGRDDLEKKVIRCVGDAGERFSEDALRILRGVRFAAQLGFGIAPETKAGMSALAENLKKISAERIRVELVKLITSDHPEMLEEAYQLGITKEFLPEFDILMKTEQETPHHRYNVGIHTLVSMEKIPNDKVLRLTMLLHDMGKPQYKTIDEAGRAHFKKHALGSEELAKNILRRLKFDNETRRQVVKLVCYHDYRMPATPKAVRRAVNKIGKDLFPLYLQVRRADTLAQSEYRQKEKLENIQAIREIFQEIEERGECTEIQELAVNGRDLLALGVPPGKTIGEELARLLDLVIENPELNRKEHLLKEVKLLYNEEDKN